MLEQGLNKKSQKVAPIFSCESCDYNTCKKTDLKKHYETKKHLATFSYKSSYKLNKKNRKKSLSSQLSIPPDHLQSESENIVMNIVTDFQIVDEMSPDHIIDNSDKENNNECICGKKYYSRSGLWYHKKKCGFSDSVATEEYSTNVSDPPSDTNDAIVEKAREPAPKFDAEMLNAFMTIMKQNQEFKELMIEQSNEQHKHNQDIQNQLLELAKEGKTINTTNNSFNLHVYLNETCKDAINMLDYVNSLKLDLTDLEETGKLGYTNGMSRIFINGLKDMDVHLRPIHCSDLKREVLYIKEDNVWEKDNENRDKIKRAIRMIEKKNIMQIPVWIKAHPNCVISSNRENTPYLKMVMQSTGGENPAETADMAKIITNIAKAVVINKSSNF
jgi:hypothetical protein